jgi:transcriptional regulator GlxA family with amidase domain
VPAAGDLGCSAQYPSIRVNAAKSLVTSGEGHRIILAGGGMSWQDLALYLIGLFVGIEEAVEVARVFVVAWHEAGQLPYASLMLSHPGDDGIIGS